MGRTILDYGLDRINKSVYLGSIKDIALKALEKKLSTWLKVKGDATDSIIVISVAAQQIQSMRVYGKNDLDKDELSGHKTTLIL